MKNFILFCLLLTYGYSEVPYYTVRRIVEESNVYEVTPTGSMKPTFDENYILLVKKQDFKKLKIGDIILWQCPDSITWADGKKHFLICHRIWGISSGHSMLLTKGDNNFQIDDIQITEDMYVGTVVGFIKKDENE